MARNEQEVQLAMHTQLSIWIFRQARIQIQMTTSIQHTLKRWELVAIQQHNNQIQGAKITIPQSQKRHAEENLWIKTHLETLWTIEIQSIAELAGKIS